MDNQTRIINISDDYFNDFDEEVVVVDLDEDVDDEDLEVISADEDEDDAATGYDPEGIIDPLDVFDALEYERAYIDSQAKFWEMATGKDRMRKIEEGVHIPNFNNTLESLFYGHPANIDNAQPSPFTNSGLYTCKNGSDVTLTDNWNRGYNLSPTFSARGALAKKLQKMIDIDMRDVDMLYFIARFSYVTPYALAILTGQRVSDVVARMTLLTRAGYAETVIAISGPIYHMNKVAAKRLNLKGFNKRDKPSLTFLRHNHIVSVMAAELERGRLKLFDSHEIPNSRVTPKWGDGEKIAPHGSLWGTNPYQWELPIPGNKLRFGERLVSEYEATSAMTKMKKNTGLTAAQILDDVPLVYTDGGLSPELKVGNEHLFFVTRPMTSKEHAPDLIIKRPRNSEGKAESICVEVELNIKKNTEQGKTAVDYYRELLQSVLTHGAYGHVVYATPDKKIALALEKAMQQVEENPLPNMAGKPGDRLHIMQIDW